MLWEERHLVFDTLRTPITPDLYKIAMNESAPYKEAPTSIQKESAKKAGVMLLLYPKQKKIHTVLIQRPEYDGHHSKQISLPGGKFELQDDNLISTALRETEEEIGVLAADVEIINTLSPLFIPPSNFYVEPAIGWVDYTPSFIPETNEVDSIIEIPIEDFINHPTLKKHPFTVSEKLTIQAPAFTIQDYKIWGATCLILNEFRWVLKQKFS